MNSIVFVTTSDLSGDRGHNVATMEIASALVDHPDLETTVVCPEPVGEFPEDFEREVERFYYLPKRRDEGIRTRIVTQISLLWTLWVAVRQVDPDAIVVRHAPTMISPPIVALVTGRPYVLLARGLSHEDLKFSALLTRIFRFNVRAADQIYAAFREITDRTEAIRGPGRSETDLVPNAVDPSKFTPTDAVTARERLDLRFDASDFVVGFVGTLEAYHMVDRLLLAVASFDADVKVLVVGDGPERASLEELSRREGLTDRVEFAGYVDHDEIDAYISACDVMYGAIDPAHPGNAIKCYEYLVCERPIITDEREAFRFVEAEDVGVTVADVTEAEIREAIHELRDRPQEEREEMGRRGARYVRRNHTWAGFADTIAADVARLSE